MSNKKVVLVTGSTGLVGRNLVSYLKRNSYNVLTLSKSDHNATVNLDLSSKSVNFENLQIENVISIVHCAFQIPNNKEEDNPSLLKTNKQITENIIRLTKYCNLESFINLSSVAVYPIISGTYDESTTPNPEKNWNTNYGLSKLYAEKKITEFLDIPVAHLRISQLLDSENFQDSLTSKFKDELENYNKITVFGNEKRAANFIRLNYLNNIVQKIIEKPINGVFNTGEKVMTYYDLANYVANELGFKTFKLEVKNIEKDTFFNIDTSKLQKAISLS